MELVVHIPQSLPDAMQRSPEEFAREAKMAMAVKLYEMKRLSSGMAAQLAANATPWSDGASACESGGSVARARTRI